MRYFQARVLSIAVLLTVTLLSSSCIDNTYDLSNINTDEITIGDQLTLPLGSGSIVANDLLNIDENSDITVDEAGNYIISYPGTVDIEVPQNIHLLDFDLQDIFIPLSNFSLSGIQLPAGQTIPLAQQELDLEFNKTDEIIRFDSALFNTESGQSLFYVHLQLSGLTLLEGEADASVKITFPEGYAFVPSTTEGVEIDQNRIILTMPISQLIGSGITTNLQILRAIVHDEDKISYKIDLLPQSTGVRLSANSSASIRLQSGMKALNFQYIYGDFMDDYEIQSLTISTDRLDDIFEGEENNLSFYDPHIRFETQSNIGIGFDINLQLTAFNSRTNQQEQMQIDHIQLEAPTIGGDIASNYIWIGAHNESVTMPNYGFIACDRIDDLIRIIPNQLEFKASASATPAANNLQFFASEPYAKINYTLEIPMSPAQDFQAHTSQIIEEAFDQDLIDYLFTGGSVEIKGKISNSLPFNFDMSLVVLDSEQQPVGIDLPAQQVKGHSGPQGSTTTSSVSFLITQNDMDKMANARHLKIALTAHCDSQLEGISLRPDQEVRLDLSLIRTGGIAL